MNIKQFILALSLFLITTLIYFNVTSPFRVEFKGHENKIFAHRVNSLEKLNSSLKLFKGVELDLIFNTNTKEFDVNHSPQKSINLNLSKYLSNVDDKTFFLWLDIKNLNSKNSLEIFHRIEYLIKKYKFHKENFLIESTSFNSLNIFLENEYRCSYYITENLNKLTSNNFNKRIDKIQQQLSTQRNVGISSDYINYPIFKSHFPMRIKYHWDISRFFSRNPFTLYNMLNDTTVKIVLIHYKSPTGNR